MINGTKLLGKDNPWAPSGNTAETTKALAAATARPIAPLRRSFLGSPGPRVRVPGVPSVPAWLSELPRRIGAWLYVRNDTEAGWRHWQVTELRDGLARSYWDPRFEVLRQLYDLFDGLPAARSAERDKPLP